MTLSNSMMFDVLSRLRFRRAVHRVRYQKKMGLIHSWQVGTRNLCGNAHLIVEDCAQWKMGRNCATLAFTSS